MSLLTSMTAARTVETPAASMRTYAGPSTDGAADVSVWRTEMAAGAAGPVHVVDTDHVVVVLEGHLSATVDGTTMAAGPGDGVLLPAGSERQLVAGSSGVTTLTAARPGSTARVGDAEPVPIPWAR